MMGLIANPKEICNGDAKYFSAPIVWDGSVRDLFKGRSESENFSSEIRRSQKKTATRGGLTGGR